MSAVKFPRITTRGTCKGVLCKCGHWQLLGVYVAAHAHVKLYNTCKCGRELMLLGERVAMTKDIK